VLGRGMGGLMGVSVACFVVFFKGGDGVNWKGR